MSCHRLGFSCTVAPALRLNIATRHWQRMEINHLEQPAGGTRLAGSPGTLPENFPGQKNTAILQNNAPEFPKILLPTALILRTART